MVRLVGDTGAAPFELGAKYFKIGIFRGFE